MAGRGYGEKFRQSFNDAENDGKLRPQFIMVCEMVCGMRWLVA